MRTSVEYTAEGLNNAYWNGDQIVIWGAGTGWRSLASCPDVVAHEWGHAVTDHLSDLVYQKQSGALNESFSDMMGAAFEFSIDTLDTPDWYMGENGTIYGNGIRNMAEPHLAGDPDYYVDDPYWRDTEGCSPSGSNDQCGVHTNSGVGNKWFYLMSEGGIHHDIEVTGIGVSNAMKIAFAANAFYWVSNSDYEHAAMGTVLAAQDLDSTGVWSDQALLAWRAVGVPVPQPSLTFDYSELPNALHVDSMVTVGVNVTGQWLGQPVAESGVLHFSLNDSDYVQHSMDELSPGMYQVELPVMICGDRMSYFFSAQEVGGEVFYSPDTLSPQIALAMSDLSAIVYDDFESDLGWSVSGDAWSGLWVREIPGGGGYEGDPPTDYDGSGSCWLTGNEPDFSEVNYGTTVLTSPLFALENDAVISYARWFTNHDWSETGEDVLRVSLSNDSGQSWVQVDSAGPVFQSDGGWYRTEIVVSDYIEPTDQMMMRFEASDVGDGNLVEAALDAFSVTEYLCYECGDLDGDGKVNLGDITRMISFVYVGGEAPDPTVSANVNGSEDGKINLGDITRLISHVYVDSSPLDCR
jgi:hypothetical protein